jgi:hypothetical protein
MEGSDIQSTRTGNSEFVEYKLVNSSIRLSDSITTKTANADDQFHSILPAAVYADGALAIPRFQ